MERLEMQGSYPLTKDKIDEMITRISAGNYALGYRDVDGSFVVKYVGRADVDVSDRLKQHVDEKYKRFKYSYASSPKAAFEKECHNYHDFGENKKPG